MTRVRPGPRYQQGKWGEEEKAEKGRGEKLRGKKAEGHKHQKESEKHLGGGGGIMGMGAANKARNEERRKEETDSPESRDGQTKRQYETGQGSRDTVGLVEGGWGCLSWLK